jgi:hypothetical protein
MLQHTTRRWREGSQAWCWAGEVSLQTAPPLQRVLPTAPLACSHSAFSGGVQVPLLMVALLWQEIICWVICPGGPAAAAQSAIGFAAFSFVMDKFQMAQEAEAAANPGSAAQVPICAEHRVRTSKPSGTRWTYS